MIPGSGCGRHRYTLSERSPVPSVDALSGLMFYLYISEWEGGDEWIRAQFKDYLQSLMATVLAEGWYIRSTTPLPHPPHFGPST